VSYDYWFVSQNSLPKKLVASQAAEKLAENQAILEKSGEYLAQVEATPQGLKMKLLNRKITSDISSFTIFGHFLLHIVLNYFLNGTKFLKDQIYLFLLHFLFRLLLETKLLFETGL
jgi:hypothetical protein